MMSMTFKKWSAFLSVQRVIDDFINYIILSNSTGICISEESVQCSKDM